MLIDWFTVGAQVLNFIILVWLMKRFLYKPILDAIDARETRIASDLADAAATKAAAEQERDEIRNRNDIFDRERAGLLRRATDGARAERERLLDAARAEADARMAKSRDSSNTDAADFLAALRRKTQAEVFAVARRTLGDLAATELEQCVVAVFLARLRSLDSASKARLAQALADAGESALVRSAFALAPAQHAEIRRAIKETVSRDVPLHFETAPDLVCGIELATAGQKVAWSIDAYLGAMERSVGEFNVARTKPAPVRS